MKSFVKKVTVLAVAFSMLASGPDGIQPFLYLDYDMLRCNLWGDGTIKD